MQQIRNLFVKLSQEEVAFRAHELAGVTGEANELADEIEAVKEAKAAQLKDLNERLRLRQERCYELAGVVRSGQEKQEVECDWKRNEKSNPPTMELVRTDTGEIVESRPMTIQERQKMLHFPEARPRAVGEHEGNPLLRIGGSFLSVAAKPLLEMSLEELKQTARDIELKGFSSMNKPELVEALGQYLVFQGDVPDAPVEPTEDEVIQPGEEKDEIPF